MTIETWQPIETAPKDGSHILGTWERTWPRTPHLESVYFEGGFWSYSADGDLLTFPPTHWMPLPKGP